jgi:hypothetical protein
MADMHQCREWGTRRDRDCSEEQLELQLVADQPPHVVGCDLALPIDDERLSFYGRNSSEQPSDTHHLQWNHAGDH